MPIGPQEGRLAPVRYPTLNPTVVALNKDALWWICVSCASTLRRRDDPDYYLLRPPVLGRGYAPKRRTATTRGASSSLRALLSACGCGLMRRTLQSQLFLHHPFG